MLSEWVRAMRQTSPSQTNGDNPFFTRTMLVCSNARLSMSFGSTGGVVVEDLAEMGTIDVISRATGCGLASWAKAVWQKIPRINAKSGSRNIANLTWSSG